jgi:hypothetical protein
MLAMPGAPTVLGNDGHQQNQHQQNNNDRDDRDRDDDDDDDDRGNGQDSNQLVILRAGSVAVR